MRRLRATQGVFYKPLPTFAAQIKAGVMIHFVADLAVVGVVESFKNVLNFLQMIAVIICVFFHRVERRVNLQAYDITSVVLGIEGLFATVACIVDHSLGSFSA